MTGFITLGKIGLGFDDSAFVTPAISSVVYKNFAEKKFCQLNRWLCEKIFSQLSH
jgi:hypothetical protein